MRTTPVGCGRKKIHLRLSIHRQPHAEPKLREQSLSEAPKGCRGVETAQDRDYKRGASSPQTFFSWRLTRVRFLWKKQLITSGYATQKLRRVDSNSLLIVTTGQIYNQFFRQLAKELHVNLHNAEEVYNLLFVCPELGYCVELRNLFLKGQHNHPSLMSNFAKLFNPIWIDEEYHRVFLAFPRLEIRNIIYHLECCHDGAYSKMMEGKILAMSPNRATLQEIWDSHPSWRNSRIREALEAQ